MPSSHDLLCTNSFLVDIAFRFYNFPPMVGNGFLFFPSVSGLVVRVGWLGLLVGDGAVGAAQQRAC